MSVAASSIRRSFWLLVALVVFSPVVAWAAFDDVTLSDVTIALTVSGSSLNVTASSATIETITVGDGTFDVTLRSGSSITVTSADKSDFSVTPSTGVTISITCGSSSSTLTLSSGDGTFTVSPQGANSCSSAAAAATTGGAGGGLAGSITQNIPPTSIPGLPPPAPSAIKVEFARDLGIGDEGDDVVRLQTLLAVDASIYPQGLITGYYGPLTVAAVKRFQTRFGLPPVGRVGPLTRAKLTEVFAKTLPAAPSVAAPPTAAVALGPLVRTLRMPSWGDDVSLLQTFFAKDPELYPEGFVTGYFGLATEAAVKRFQTKYGLEPVGIVGSQTRLKLNGLLGTFSAPTPAPVPPPQAPSLSEQQQLEALQAQLRALQEQLKSLQRP